MDIAPVNAEKNFSVVFKANFTGGGASKNYGPYNLAVKCTLNTTTFIKTGYNDSAEFVSNYS